MKELVLKRKKALYIIMSVIILSTLMNIVDVFVKPQYLVRSIVKVILFLIVPILYFYFFKEEVNGIKQLFIPRKKDFFKFFLLGVSIYIIIIVGYLLFNNTIDFSSITKSLISNIGVNANNFIYVSVYISFFNSFLEEFFFRGFAFITLKKQTNQKFAYIFSALLFSLYHAGMTTGWFNIVFYLLILVCLFIGGCIFNYLNEKCNHIYPSWLVHMFANFGINTVGFILFGII